MLVTPIIKLEGDKIAALKWLGYARAKLNNLVSSMQAAGLVQNQVYFRPIPGVRIKCSKSFNITRIIIAVTGGGKEVVTQISKWYWYAILTGGTLHYIIDVAIDGVQGVWMCGGYSDSLTPGTSFGDNAIVIHHDTDGNYIDSKMITEQTEFEFANSICIDSLDNKFITLDHYSSRDDGYYDSALVKFSTDSTVAWSTKIGTAATNTTHTDSNIGINDDIYTCGYSTASIYAGGYRWIGFVNKFTTDGSLSWNRLLFYGDVGTPLAPEGLVRFERLAIDSSDNIYAIGLDSGDSNYLNGGGLGFGQGSIFKIDSSGILQWIKQIYSDSFALVQYDSFWPTDIVIDSNDDIYVLCVHADRTDSSNGYMRYYLVKLNSSGVIQWQKRIDSPYSGGEGNFVPLGFPATFPRLAITNRDEIIFLINSYDLDGEYLLTKFDSDGTLIWLRSIDFADIYVFFSSVKVDQDGDVIIAGDLETSLQAFVTKIPSVGSIAGKHKELIFANPDVTVETSGVLIRAGAGNIINGTGLYSSSTGTYALEDLELSNKTTKILIEKTVTKRSI